MWVRGVGERLGCFGVVSELFGRVLFVWEIVWEGEEEKEEEGGRGRRLFGRKEREKVFLCQWRGGGCFGGWLFRACEGVASTGLPEKREGEGAIEI